MIISERIFCILKEKGISQKAFSEMTGIAQSTISDWKRKKTNPTSDKLMIISKVLDVSLFELLGANEENEEHLVIGKNSEEYKFLEAYRSLETNQKAMLMGYMDAMLRKTY